PALTSLVRAMLNQRENWHYEKPAKKPQEKQIRFHCVKAESRPCEQQPHRADPNRTERNQAVLDLAAGKFSRRIAAEPDSESDGRLHIAIAGIGDSQDVLAVEQGIEQQQRAEEIKVDVAPDRQFQNPVAPDGPHLDYQFLDEINAQLALGVGGRKPRN